MRYNELPQTTLKVSNICIGTMTFADKVDEEEAKRCCDLAIDKGVNFFDTADIYPGSPTAGAGSSEIFLGNALEGKRDKVVIATKVGGGMDPRNGKFGGLSEEYVTQEVEDSLKRLKTDYIDIYYAHFPDNKVTSREFVVTMNKLIDSGKIRYYGVSNFAAWKMCEMVFTAKELGLKPPVITQNGYNMLTRGVEDEIVPFTDSYDMSVVAFNPLAGGMLTGKYQQNSEIKGNRLADNRGYRARYYSELNRDAVDELTAMAEELDMTLIEFAYRWLLSRKRLYAALLGFSSEKQLESNLNVLTEEKEISFPEEKIDKIWRDITGNRFSVHR